MRNTLRSSSFLLALVTLVVLPVLLEASSAKLQIDVGLNHFYKKRYLEAFREFKAAAEADPRNADAHYNLGRVYKIQGFLKEAVAEFQLSLALNPNLTAARRELLEIQGYIKSDVTTQLKLQGQEEALKQRISDVGSNTALKRGQEFLNRGDTARAIPEFEQAVQADPYNAKILKVLGYLYFRSNRYANALSSYERAQRLAPDDAEIAYDLGLIHLRSDNAKGAADSFQRAISLDANLVKAHYGLGEAYETLGQFEDAAFQYRKCLELNPGLKQAEDRVRDLSGKLGYMYFTRGSFYYQQGDFEKAEALLSLSAKYGSLTDAQKRQVNDMLGAARYWVGKKQATDKVNYERREIREDSYVNKTLSVEQVVRNPQSYVGQAVEWEGGAVCSTDSKGKTIYVVNTNPNVNSDNNLEFSFGVIFPKELPTDPRVTDCYSDIRVKGKILRVEKVMNTFTSFMSRDRQPIIEASEVTFSRENYPDSLVLRFY